MEDKAMLESNLSAIWGFAGEWCLVGTTPFFAFNAGCLVLTKHHSPGKTKR